MKKLAFLTLIAALVFGVQPQNATAAEINDGPSLALPTGEAKIVFDQAESLLVIDMSTAGDRERVTISILNRNHQLVSERIMIVDGRGDSLEMELKHLDRGTYYVNVESTSINAAGKIYKR